jgi:hypothetical protein
LRIGDLDTEESTLDPLAKSTLHYLRLLLYPETVKHFEVRTATEIQADKRFRLPPLIKDKVAQPQIDRGERKRNHHD